MLCIVWCIFWSLFIFVNSDIFRHIHVQFRHIHPYCGIVRTLHNCFIFRILAYLEPKICSELCQARHILAYSDHILRTLADSEFCHIQNFGIFRSLGIFTILFIYAHSGLFTNDSYNQVIVHTVSFYSFNLKYFPANFKNTCFFYYSDINFNAWVSLLK